MPTTIYTGDALGVLRTLSSATVQTCVTSPPYFGLRDYQTGRWEGGRDDCAHETVPDTRHRTPDPSSSRTVPVRREARCSQCGAHRVDFQLGIERTPEEYVAKVVAVFHEVRRVLRDDGTLWLVLGDSYAGSWGARGRGSRTAAPRPDWERKHGTLAPARSVPGLKPKDLVGIPWRVAFALQRDGWYFRSDCVWAKPNPTPESVRDRPTRAHEFVFLLSKSPRYYYDAMAIAEPAIYAGHVQHRPKPTAKNAEAAQLGRTVVGFTRGDIKVGATRNRRTVWTIPTQPFRGAHFAVFPTKLAELCVLAGSSPAACEQCGAPWRRETSRTTAAFGGSGRAGRAASEVNASGKWAGLQHGAQLKLGPVVTTTTIGWSPTCRCSGNEGRAYCTVLDPFAGAGTTGLVAARLGRDALLIELNPHYAELSRARIASDAPLVDRVKVVVPRADVP